MRSLGTPARLAQAPRETLRALACDGNARALRGTRSRRNHAGARCDDRSQPHAIHL